MNSIFFEKRFSGHHSRSADLAHAGAARAWLVAIVSVGAPSSKRSATIVWTAGMTYHTTRRMLGSSKMLRGSSGRLHMSTRRER